MHSEEIDRLAALDRLCLLSGKAHPVLDEITALAAELSEWPIAAISLVDLNRQVFVSKVGTTVEQTSRSASFCTHTIKNKSPLVVENALSDPNFATNPLVVGSPHIRAYAGFPLTQSQGWAVGTLCVIHHEPASLSANAHRHLTRLAVMTIEVLKREEVTAPGLRGLQQSITAERHRFIQGGAVKAGQSSGRSASP